MTTNQLILFNESDTATSTISSEILQKINSMQFWPSINMSTLQITSTPTITTINQSLHYAGSIYAEAYPHAEEKNLTDYYSINRDYNKTCDDQDQLDDSTYFQTTVYMLYTSIFVLALVGNGVVCYIVYSSPRMKTVTNYFIVNLAVGDIMMSLFCVPFSFVSILLLQYWPFGSLLCHLVNYSQAVSVLVSAYTLVAISIDRYMAILWPLRPRVSKRYVFVYLFIIIFYCCLFCVCVLFSFAFK